MFFTFTLIADISWISIQTSPEHTPVSTFPNENEAFCWNEESHDNHETGGVKKVLSQVYDFLSSDEDSENETPVVRSKSDQPMGLLQRISTSRWWPGSWAMQREESKLELPMEDQDLMGVGLVRAKKEEKKVVSASIDLLDDLFM